MPPPLDKRRLVNEPSVSTPSPVLASTRPPVSTPSPVLANPHPAEPEGEGLDKLSRTELQELCVKTSRRMRQLDSKLASAKNMISVLVQHLQAVDGAVGSLVGVSLVDYFRDRAGAGEATPPARIVGRGLPHPQSVTATPPPAASASLRVAAESTPPAPVASPLRALLLAGSTLDVIAYSAALARQCAAVAAPQGVDAGAPSMDVAGQATPIATAAASIAGSGSVPPPPAPASALGSGGAAALTSARAQVSRLSSDLAALQRQLGAAREETARLQVNSTTTVARGHGVRAHHSSPAPPSRRRGTLRRGRAGGGRAWP